MSTAQQNVVAINGSINTIIEYLDSAINMILYQRDICPKDEFKSVTKYNLPLFVTTNPKITFEINSILDKFKDLIPKKPQDLDLRLSFYDKPTNEALEFWDFKIEYKNTNSADVSKKSSADIQREIRLVMKQITAINSSLPALAASGCWFELNIRFIGDVPGWYTVENKLKMKNPEVLNLRSFSTGIHKLHTSVIYKKDEREM